MKRRAPCPGFNPRSRGQIIRAVSISGSFLSTKSGVSFGIFKGLQGVILLISEGRRWRQFPASTCWDALDIVEQRIRKGPNADVPIYESTDRETASAPIG